MSHFEKFQICPRSILLCCLFFLEMRRLEIDIYNKAEYDFESRKKIIQIPVDLFLGTEYNFCPQK